MKTSPKDRQAIDQLFKEHHYTDDLGVIKSKLAGYVAGVRQEERAAAFKDIRELITTVNPRLTFGAANGSVMKQSILGTVDTFTECDAALQAATTKQPTEVKGRKTDA